MIDFFKRGAKKIIPLSNPEDIRYYKKKYPDFLIAGDYHHEYPDLFDVNIFNRESYDNFNPKGKNIFYISYNGTRRITESVNAKAHYLGSLLNLSALVEEISGKSHEFCFLLAMSKVFGGDEDLAFAEIVIKMLKKEKVDFKPYFQRILQSKCALEGTLLLGAPFLIELACNVDTTNLIPVSYFDEKLNMTAVKILSKI